jgi:hypothetical protein
MDEFYETVLIKTRLQIGLRGKKTELTGRGPSRRQRSLLDWRRERER